MDTQAQTVLEEIVRKMGFNDFSITPSEDARRFSVFINDAPFVSRHLPGVVADLDFVFKTILKKKGIELAFVDVNNYRKEREDIIIKLAKAAAKKCATIKQDVELPPMNSFERRIIHTELAMNPDIRTQSAGEGKTRHVVIQPLN